VLYCFESRPARRNNANPRCSFGMIVFETVAGQRRLAEGDQLKPSWTPHRDAAAAARYRDWSELVRVFSRCTAEDPSERPAISELTFTARPSSLVDLHDQSVG
jgi:hypothetical protein